MSAIGQDGCAGVVNCSEHELILCWGQALSGFGANRCTPGTPLIPLVAGRYPASNLMVTSVSEAI
jgi:hypothetical protein